VGDFARYLFRLARHHSISSASAVITFGLSAAGAAGVQVAIPPWAWLALGEAALVMAGFLDWRGSRLMEPGEQAWLQRILESVISAVQGNLPCAYSDGKTADDRVKERFRSHFEEDLVPLMDEWDSMPARIGTAQNEASRFVRSEADEKWPSLNAPVVAHVLFTQIQGNIRQLDQMREAPFYISAEGEPHAAIIGISSVVKNIAEMDEEDRSDLPGTVDRLNAWSLTLRQSAPIQAWARLLSDRDQLRSRLIRELGRFRPPAQFRKRRCDEQCEPR
jgi:hypothetical protein